MNPDEALWKVTIKYKDRNRADLVRRRQTNKEARDWERRALNEDAIASVKVERETRLK